MLYSITRPLARIALRINFRKIHFSNADRIPWDKPVILAANHPTSFIEPCLLATHLSKPLYFLARGDLFKKPFYIKALNSFHILPIYRLKDGGYGKIKNNYSTFDKCFDALKEKKTILIMAEGRCIQEKRLRPIRKGTSRLAFGAYEKFGDLDIHVVPVGVNYTYPDKFRSEVMIDFGEPILVADYLKLYDKDPFEATRMITNDLEEGLRERVVVINEVEDEPLTESLLILKRNTNSNKKSGRVLERKDHRLIKEIEIAATVNEMDVEHKNSLSQSVNKYFSDLTSKKISDWGLMHVDYAGFRKFIYLLIGFIPFCIGFVANYLPMKYTQYVVNTKVKDVEDKMSVGVAIAIGAYIVYLILGLIVAAVAKSYFVLIFLLFILPLGFFAINYMEIYKKWIESRSAKKA